MVREGTLIDTGFIGITIGKIDDRETIGKDIDVMIVVLNGNVADDVTLKNNNFPDWKLKFSVNILTTFYQHRYFSTDPLNSGYLFHPRVVS